MLRTGQRKGVEVSLCRARFEVGRVSRVQGRQAFRQGGNRPSLSLPRPVFFHVVGQAGELLGGHP